MVPLVVPPTPPPPAFTPSALVRPTAEVDRAGPERIRAMQQDMVDRIASRNREGSGRESEAGDETAIGDQELPPPYDAVAESRGGGLERR